MKVMMPMAEEARASDTVISAAAVKPSSRDLRWPEAHQLVSTIGRQATSVEKLKRNR